MNEPELVNVSPSLIVALGPAFTAGTVFTAFTVTRAVAVTAAVPSFTATVTVYGMTSALV